MDYVLGIDLGTSYLKAGIVDSSGNLAGLGRISVPVDRTMAYSWELKTDKFWKLLKDGILAACSQANISAEEISAVSYSSQANSFLLLDAENKPLTPLILWPDTRMRESDPRLDHLWSNRDYLQVTGMSLRSPELCIYKLCWFQKNHPELWDKTARIMTISDYLTFILTGEYLGDEGTASLLGIWNLKEHDWWYDALSLLDISRSQLSTLLKPGTKAGKVIKEASVLSGLKPGIPFAVGSLDHHMAAAGSGVGMIADLSESTGTVLACCLSPVEYLPAHGCCMGPDFKDEKYYRLSFNNNGGRGLEWYRENFSPDLTLSELGKLAMKIGIGSGGLIVRPEVFTYSGVEGFINFSTEYDHGHFARAIMESTAASLKELIDVISKDKKPERILATGGGAFSDIWLQIKADLTGSEVVTTTSPEPACYGAAMIAAVIAGWYSDIDDVSQSWVRIKKSYKPDMERNRAYIKWYENYKHLNQSGSA